MEALWMSLGVVSGGNRPKTACEPSQVICIRRLEHLSRSRNAQIRMSFRGKQPLLIFSSSSLVLKWVDI
jgi:hypothetical protein